MMFSYVKTFIMTNKIKSLLVILSLALYFAAVSLTSAMSRSIEDVAALPMKSIGAETIVQKSGKIPNKMQGAIFPHSNAPIYAEDAEKLAAEPFVTDHDNALYFWYFDDSFFKSVLGVHSDKGIYADILKNSIIKGGYPSDSSQVLVTEDFVKKNGIDAGGRIELGNDVFTVSGVLRSGFNGNIAPADIYMDIKPAQIIAASSAEMKNLYDIKSTDFYNMAVLKTDPLWQGDREKSIKAINKDYLVFGEQSFKKEITDKLSVLSSTASAAFIVMGVLIACGFALMIYYGIKTRENEIALLRMIGWRFVALRNHFLWESMIMTTLGLLMGNVIYALSFVLLSRLKITMELPWDISARPHFLVEENNIERVVQAPLPLDFDIWTHLAVNFGMFAACAFLTFFILLRLRNIKPAEFYRG